MNKTNGKPEVTITFFSKNSDKIIEPAEIKKALRKVLLELGF